MATKKSVTLINPDAAGIDIGSTYHFVALPEDRDENPVREFRNFTSDLNALANWLSEKDIKTIAMESTSVYWIVYYKFCIAGNKKKYHL